MSSNEASLINSDGILNNCNESCLRLDSDNSVENATNRVFIVWHEFLSSNWKQLVHSSSLK